MREGWFRSAPHLVTLGVVCIELVLILYLNHGRFSYTLDDAYIHLALSDHLSRLHYGINADESSSPSSSVLYPVLLAPFAPWSFHEYVPLVLNVAALLATMSVIAAVLRRTGFEAGRSRAFGDGLATLLALSLNLVGLVFTGMEHSLHVLVTLTVVLGLVVLVQERRVTWWILAAIVVGPLVRYEGAAVSLGAVAVLSVCRKWRLAFGAGLLCLCTLGAFSAFLVSLDLPALPSSVLVKSAVAARAVDTGLFKSLQPLARNLLRPSLSATLLMLLGALIVARLVIEHERRARWPIACLTVFAVVVIAAHLAAGHYGWFARYEIYAVAAGSLTAIHLWGSELRSVVNRAGSVRTLAATALLVAIFAGPQYFRATVTTPLAASNIYEQQYQMHRFAADYYKGPVAVNDLGWVAYRNPHYVLDLFGLGSESARQAARVHTDGSTWIADLMNRHRVELAMVYDERFKDSLPTSWSRVAILHLGRPRVVVPLPAVAFYSTSPERVPEVLVQLRRFRETLPPGTRLEILLP